MDTSTRSKKVLVASKNTVLLREARAALSKDKTLKYIDKKVNPKDLFSLIDDLQPDTILLDFAFDEEPFELMQKLTMEHASSALVAILPESEEIDSDRVLLSGARDLILYPFQSSELVDTINRALDRQDRNIRKNTPSKVEETESDRGNTFTVFSPKGGVGTTTIAINLAINLHKILKEDVLLIDGKHLFGHLALYCNIRTDHSMTDLTAHAGNLDEHLIKQVVVQHTSGIHILPSPNSIVKAQGIKPEDLYKVIQSLQKVFTYIIIDGGSTLDENTVTYMDSSQKILLALNPDIASMRDVRQFMSVASTLSYPNEKILLILNLSGRKADIKREEIEGILKMKIFGKVPADGNLALSCLNEGVPIILKKPHHPISKAFGDITKDILKTIKLS